MVQALNAYEEYTRKQQLKSIKTKNFNGKMTPRPLTQNKPKHYPRPGTALITSRRPRSLISNVHRPTTAPNPAFLDAIKAVGKANNVLPQR